MILTFDLFIPLDTMMVYIQPYVAFKRYWVPTGCEVMASGSSMGGMPLI
jgi:hypothetical protein